MLTCDQRHDRSQPPTSEGRETEAEEIVRDMIRKSLEIERKLVRIGFILPFCPASHKTHVLAVILALCRDPGYTRITCREFARSRPDNNIGPHRDVVHVDDDVVDRVEFRSEPDRNPADPVTRVARLASGSSSKSRWQRRRFRRVGSRRRRRNDVSFDHGRVARRYWFANRPNQAVQVSET